MSGQRSRKIHQRSSSTGSGLLFGIGAAAGPHHVIHPQHHLLASQQLSSPSPDPLTSDDEESEDLDIKGTLSKWTNYIHGWQDRFFALKEGTLVYYKSQLETDFGCRGAITVDKATVKPHELDELRFEVSVSDCVWYLRATSIEDRQRWIDALQLAKRSHQSLIIAEQNGRYDSAMSLASASSLRKSGHNLKEKLAEMETFKDILSQQIDKLGAHIEQYGKVGGSSEPNHLMATGGSGGESDKPSIMDFKAEAITFKATANGVLFSLATCIEIFSRSEEHWRKKLEKEQIARRRAEEKYRLAIEEAEPVKAETPSKAQVMLLNGPDFVEAPHSQIGEDEFFDAVETSLDKLQEELYYRDKLKLMGETSLVPNAPNSEAVNHPLWCTIDETTNEQLHYARLQVGQDSVWELFAEDGEMKMYTRKEEVDGMVVDPLKALHQVQGVTARELCYYFFAPDVRMEWETTLEQATVLEKVADDTLIFLQLHKRVWPSAQRDALFWSHMRCIRSDKQSQTWIVCNQSTKHPNGPENQGGCLRVDLTVCFVCDTTVDPPYTWENASRDHLTTKITYCSVVNPGGWAPASVLRAVYKREYPRFLKRFTQYVDEKCRSKKIDW